MAYNGQQPMGQPPMGHPAQQPPMHQQPMYQQPMPQQPMHQQPMHQPPMHQPPMHHAPAHNGHGHPHGGEGEWQQSAWECCKPCDMCLVGCFVPCYLIGKTSERIRDPTMQTFNAGNNDFLISLGISCLTGCGWIWTMIKRKEIRERYGIKGSGFSDCCMSYWCGCCAVIQHEKEVMRRTGAVTETYKPQPGMDAKPQH